MAGKPAGGCGGAAVATPAFAGAAALTASSPAASAAAQADAAARAIQAPLPAPVQVQVAAGGGGTPGPSTKSRMNGMDMARVPGTASQSPEAVAAYNTAKALLAKYPTEASLKAAGFGIEPNGNHYRLWEQPETFKIAGVGAAQILVKDGRTIGVQLDNKTKGAEPPPWAGVLWHSHGTQGWMTHVYTDRPIDEAFVADGM